MTVDEVGQDSPLQGLNAGLRPLDSGWVRKALANCYFHSGMPSLARPVRERYHLAISRRGRWPKLSLAKRREPSARILYYHRVNDDRDPFFPAIPPAVFEQQMRFVRKHYRVVSLPQLLESLAGSSTEPLLAITFDDGYRDNYENAYPILKGLGLPATIFLATGSMDSREPLWFEQLALAIKKTKREFLDLEKLSERFPLRTEAERLAANGRIFSMLRAVPDEKRRLWLGRVLDDLAVRDDSQRHDKMLTWDQVRLMSKNEIIFGGHTVNHSFLSRLPREEARWEVSECKRRIESELQVPADYFGYPNGREEDLGQWSKDLLHKAGYRAAVSTIWGMNYTTTDPMELRRGQPWEENQAIFAYKLDWYQFVND